MSGKNTKFNGILLSNTSMSTHYTPLPPDYFYNRVSSCMLYVNNPGKKHCQLSSAGLIVCGQSVGRPAYRSASWIMHVGADSGDGFSSRMQGLSQYHSLWATNVQQGSGKTGLSIGIGNSITSSASTLRRRRAVVCLLRLTWKNKATTLLDLYQRLLVSPLLWPF